MRVQQIIARLREARRGDIDAYTGHVLHDAEVLLQELEADNARLIGANLALQEKLSPNVCPDCHGKGGTAPNGVYYCNCEEAA